MFLNCSYGCNFGTGTKHNTLSREMSLDDVDRTFNKRKRDRLKEKSKLSQKRIDWLHKFFDKHLDWEKFQRKYTTYSLKLNLGEPGSTALNDIYLLMNKEDEERRTINCAACGYGSCEKNGNGHLSRSKCTK